MTILVVENHPDTLTALSTLLEELGHTVTRARTIAEASIALRTNHFHVLLCDVGLPDGTGWDLMKEVADPGAIFAIAMSGFGTQLDAARSRAVGFRVHLVKPFKTVDLERALAAAAAELTTKYGQPGK